MKWLAVFLGIGVVSLGIFWFKISNAEQPYIWRMEGKSIDA